VLLFKASLTSEQPCKVLLHEGPEVLAPFLAKDLAHALHLLARRSPADAPGVVCLDFEGVWCVLSVLCGLRVLCVL
jgi:hypothetical protein